MQTIAPGESGRQTTRLGFGCSSGMEAPGRAGSLQMLKAACDAALRHFHVARSFGFGEAEPCQGEFTVTMKVRIPAGKTSWQSTARLLVTLATGAAGARGAAG